MFRRTPAICSAMGTSASKSSPNTLTATSPRTPARSSLNLIWIGWVNSKLFPSCLMILASIRARTRSFVSLGSGHASRGFRITNVSETFTGIGSAAISAVPVFE